MSGHMNRQVISHLFRSLLTIGCIAGIGAPAISQVPAQPVTIAVAGANSRIDYDGFTQLVQDLAPVRRMRRMGWSMFVSQSRAPGAVLLDTRSAADFARGHLRGAVNLPFSEFTDEKLREVLGEDTDRRIYIYCNNNFSDNIPPVVSKRAPLALNIPTFINLHGYGYGNVWELAGVVSITDIENDWVTGAPALP